MGKILVVASASLQNQIISRICQTRFLGSDIYAVSFQRTRQEQILRGELFPFLPKQNMFHLDGRKRLFNLAVEINKSNIAKLNFDAVIFGSINSVKIQLLLSLIKFDRIFTVDDGTANISPASVYWKTDSEIKTEWFKRAYRAASGVRYSRDRIISESESHFTVYQNYRNVFPVTEAVQLHDFSSLPDTPKNAEEVSFLVGTVFNEAAGSTEAGRELADATLAYCQTLSAHTSVTYLPHPRDEYTSEFAEFVRELNRPAEDVIFEELKTGKLISIIGFSNSTQFYFGHCKKVNLIVFDHPLLKPSAKALLDTMVRSGADVVSLHAPDDGSVS